MGGYRDQDASCIMPVVRIVRNSWIIFLSNGAKLRGAPSRSWQSSSALLWTTASVHTLEAIRNQALAPSNRPRYIDILGMCSFGFCVVFIDPNGDGIGANIEVKHTQVQRGMTPLGKLFVVSRKIVERGRE